jgi:hypothetical protein
VKTPSPEKLYDRLVAPRLLPRAHSIIGHMPTPVEKLNPQELKSAYTWVWQQDRNLPITAWEKRFLTSIVTLTRISEAQHRVACRIVSKTLAALQRRFRSGDSESRQPYHQLSNLVFPLPASLSAE